jgi:opacity protein-like surface antigen
LLTALSFAPAAPAQTTDAERAQADEIAELKRQLDVVVDELSSLRTRLAVPEEDHELESHHGLGPAASKVYGAGRGLSIGGYAEGFYSKRRSGSVGDGRDTADMLRTVLYFGYKFTPQWVFNTEIEFEHATTSGGSGEVSLEFATLDYLYEPELNFRGGLVLIPMGFLNEMHEPPYYFGTQRPEPEKRIIPTTWREMGVGVFGNLTEQLSYRAYVVNGMDASSFSSGGIRGGRQKGSKTEASDLAFVTRVDFDPTPGLRVGGSYYIGDSGQNLSGMPSARTDVWEVHTQYQRGPWHLRGLYTEAHLEDTLDLSAALGDSIASRMIGGYGEIAYDLMRWIQPDSEKALWPFFRFEYVDTQYDLPSGVPEATLEARRIYTAGFSYKPIPNIVLKAEYRSIDPLSGSSTDEFNLGFGLDF